MRNNKVGELPKQRWIEYREWQEKTVYKVLVSFHPDETAYEAVLYITNFSWGEPEGFIWSGSEYAPRPAESAFLLVYLRKLCSLA